MADEGVLFVVLAAIYISDCFLWLQKDTIAFFTWWGKNWQWKIASLYVSTSKGGLLLLNMLPPLGKVMCSHTLPLSISPLGVCQFVSQTPPCATRLEYAGNVVLFKEMQTVVRRSRDLFLNDSLFCKFHSTRQAQLIESLLNTLLQNSVESRPSYLEQFWQKQFDLKGATRVFKNIWPKFNILKRLCVLLFAFIFAFAPVMTYFYGLSRILIGTAIIMLMIAAIITYKFYTLHKELCPFDSEDRISNVATMLLCPPVAIRACDLFAKNIMVQFHPLATAHACLTESQFIIFADMILRDMQHPIPFHLEEPNAMEICQWHNSKIVSVAESSLPKKYNLIDRLTKSPIREDKSILSYCPRCLRQLQLRQGTCHDCSGVKLLPFLKSKKNNVKGDE